MIRVPDRYEFPGGSPLSPPGEEDENGSPVSCNGNIYFEFPLNDPEQNFTLDKVTEVHIPFLPEKKLRGKCDIMTNETFPRSDCGNRKVFHNEPQTVGGWM